jgi:hypothetical protein
MSYLIITESKNTVTAVVVVVFVYFLIIIACGFIYLFFLQKKI